MRILLAVLLLASLGCKAQVMKDTVSFVVRFSTSTATKDGYYLNGYVVSLETTEAARLNGKMIRVSGIVTTVPGIASQPAEYDDKGNRIINQGRDENTLHILKPVVEIVRE